MENLIKSIKYTDRNVFNNFLEQTIFHAVFHKLIHFSISRVSVLFIAYFIYFFLFLIPHHVVSSTHPFPSFQPANLLLYVSSFAYF